MVTPASGAAAKLSFDDASADAPRTGEVVHLRLPRRETTLAEQYARQVDMLEAALAAKAAAQPAGSTAQQHQRIVDNPTIRAQAQMQSDHFGI